MVDEFRLVRLQLHGVPHHRVQIGEVVVHVVAFVAETTQSPASELGSLWTKQLSLTHDCILYNRGSVGHY